MNIYEAKEIVKKGAELEGTEAGDQWVALLEFHESADHYVLGKDFIRAIADEIIRIANEIQTEWKVITYDNGPSISDEFKKIFKGDEKEGEEFLERLKRLDLQEESVYLEYVGKNND